MACRVAVGVHGVECTIYGLVVKIKNIWAYLTLMTGPSSREILTQKIIFTTPPILEFLDGFCDFFCISILF
tara:strand:- start:1158 stop:1370 length:213 start_codon:yes stop_codon:yes gene_type:complete